MSNGKSNKVSIWLVVVIGLLIAIAPTWLESYQKRQEKKRLFLLHQVQAYGSLYLTSVGGTVGEFLRNANEEIIYIEPKEIDLITSIIYPTFSIVHTPTYIHNRVRGEELSRELLNSYLDKLEKYTREYINREYSIDRDKTGLSFKGIEKEIEK